MLPSGLVPKPELDQHFLVDEQVISRMIAAASITSEDIVVDLGAGIGSITSRIPACKEKIAIELDPDLATELRKIPDIKVVLGNALELIKRYQFSVLLSNLPYTIAEPLIRLLWKLDFDRGVILLPKGFSSALISGDSAVGERSGYFFQMELLEDIMPASYEPQPAVLSSMILLKKKPADLMQLILRQDDKILRNAVREGFVQGGGMTKREARQKTESLDLPVFLGEKDVKSLNPDEIRLLSRLLIGNLGTLGSSKN
jgi:16S rRNA (adenine1518-N6/adenine1519-N6)-dimethyltransferase